jgi:hypothetical protein
MIDERERRLDPEVDGHSQIRSEQAAVEPAQHGMKVRTPLTGP